MNNKTRTAAIVMLTAILGISICSCKGNSTGGKPTSSMNQMASEDSLQLPLPAVPEELRSPEERAAFVSSHFWDALDFSRDSRSLDTAFIEQNFANYLAVLSVTPEADARKAVSRLLTESAKSEKADGLLRHVIVKYLDDPNSPMRSEDLLIYFLEEWSKPEERDEALRLRAEHRLSEVLKNRRGTRAADFRITGNDGKETTLLKTLKGETIVMFYDPDCEQCREAKELLAKSPLPEGVELMAIDIAGDRRRHEATKGSMPAAWTVWFDSEGIEDNEKYVFQAMPTFYVLGADGTVLMKDPPIETFLSQQ